jgi:hypothetical protein
MFESLKDLATRITEEKIKEIEIEKRIREIIDEKK